MSSLDHQLKAESRIYAQYRDKPKFVQWMGIVGNLGNEIEQAYCDIAQSYDIDSAGTDELDVIGRIVDINRSHESNLAIPQFECNDTDVECGEPAVECTPGSLSASQQVSDEIYRLLIKAKIAKNNNDATMDGISNALNEIFPDTITTVNDPEDMSFTVSFSRLLNPVELLVITNFDLTPKPQGVLFAGFFQTPSLVLCGESWAQCGEPNAQCTFVF